MNSYCVCVCVDGKINTEARDTRNKKIREREREIRKNGVSDYVRRRSGSVWVQTREPQWTEFCGSTDHESSGGR